MNYSSIICAAKKAPYSEQRRLWREAVEAGVKAYPDIVDIAEEFSDDAKAIQRARGSESVLFGPKVALELLAVIGGFLADLESLDGKGVKEWKTKL